MARSVFKAVLLSTAAATLAAAPPLFAQGAGNSSTGDGLDIVVTAQKREQNINDTSLSITALGAAGLEALGRQDVTALAGQVPGLQVNQYSPTITVFNLRGVSQNDFGDSQEAPVAFYNDEVYVSALGAISGQTFDLERVEVLRGPQGTLFGRNATGGLVQIVTAKPTGSFEGFITLTGGSHGQFATEAAISGPLSDRVRGRLSFTSNHHGGYIDNDIGPDRGGTKFYAGRAQLEADVGSRGKLSLKLQGLRNDHDRTSGAYSHVALGVNEDGLGYALAADEDFWGTCAGCDAFGYRDADGDPYTGSFNFDGRFNRKYWSATLRYDHEFDGFDFVSITDYQDLEKSYSEDTDMSPAPVFVYRTNQDLYQLSQELRLSGKSDKLTWLAGLYGLKIVTNNVNQVDLLSGTPDSLVADYDGRQKTESLAVFGQVEYAFAPEVSLILGARYSWDWKEHWLTVVQTYFDGSSDRFEFNPTLFPDLAKLKFDNYSLKAQVDFRPTDGVLIYAGVNRGTKSGGFGVQSFIPDPATLPFDEEVLTNYEAGFKIQPLRGLSINGAAFYYDYDQYQAFSVIGLSQFITNNPAKVKGFELDATIRPVSGLTLQGFVTHLDTKVKDISLPFGRLADRVLPQAPSWTFGGMARYEFDIGPGAIAVQTDWKYDSSQYFSTFNSPIDREPGHAVGNARISFTTANEAVEVAGFVNNITDKKYRVYNLDISTVTGFANQTYARPRWWGASVTYRFQ